MDLSVRAFMVPLRMPPSVARIMSPISRNSSAPMPRVVQAALPTRMPEVTSGRAPSPGTAFLLTVMPICSSAVSAALPVSSQGRRSITPRWQSVPADTTDSPPCDSLSHSTRALSTTARA